MSTESELAAGEFHKQARDPKFGDVMRFSIERKDPSTDTPSTVAPRVGYGHT